MAFFLRRNYFGYVGYRFMIRLIMKWCLIATLIISFAPVYAQLKDTAEVNALYQRVYNYDEDQTDSIGIYASQISLFSERNGYVLGKAFGKRLTGIMYEFKEDYENSLRSYQQFADHALQTNDPVLISAAISDEAGIHLHLKHYEEARKCYCKYIDILKDHPNKVKLAKGFTNLGIVYRKLKVYDSALYYYNKSLAIREAAGDLAGAATVKNNIGSLLVFQNRQQEALPYFMDNLTNDLRDSSVANLYYDYSNIGSAYIGLKNFAKAETNLMKAMDLAKQMTNVAKQTELFEILGELYRLQGNFKMAFESQEQYILLKKVLLNEQNNTAIASLQEKYKAKERQQENELLATQLQTQRLQKRNLLIVAVAALMVAALIAFAFFQNRKAKQKVEKQHILIQKQNEKLGELNEEKNALISVVSHDLSGPFANIKMWNQLLESDADQLTPDQNKAIQRINSSVQSGELLIRNILDVEKAETNRRRMHLEELDLDKLVQHMIQDFSSRATTKNIRLEYQVPPIPVVILSDKQMVSRICDNLISNALKYTLPGKQVVIRVTASLGRAIIVVQDEGVGISKSELPKLFTKYGVISSKPTAGEDSTGLGLSIVKRIVEELGGKITVESVEGAGTTFTVTL